MCDQEKIRGVIPLSQLHVHEISDSQLVLVRVIQRVLLWVQGSTWKDCEEAQLI